MDELRFQASKLSSETALFFPPHRRRPLNSQTYRTLLHIFSHCYEDSFASQNLETIPNTENGCNEMGRIIEEQASQPSELVNAKGSEDKSLEKAPEVILNGDDKGSGDIMLGEQMSIDQIEQLMGLEENEDSSNQKDDADLGSLPAMMLIDELEHIVQGNEDVVSENNSKLMIDTQCQDDVERSAFQQIDVSEDANQMILCVENITNKDNESLSNIAPISPTRKQEVEPKSVFETGNSTLSTFGEFETSKNQPLLVSEDISLCEGKNTASDISKLCEKDDEQKSEETVALKLVDERRLENTDTDKPSCDIDMIDGGVCTTKGVEEGEISGGYAVDIISMEELLQDVEIQDKKADEEIITGCVTNGNEIVCSEVNVRESENPFLSIDAVDKTSDIKDLRESDRVKTVTIHNAVSLEKTSMDALNPMMEAQKIKKEVNDRHNIVVYDNIWDEDDKMSAEQDVAVRSKKNRGPRSKEQKAKKKAKERKRKAAKEGQLGVRRLKLPLISMSKPKPIRYCRHFLLGRCQEGDKCKFSHDTVPKTKAKPCCHFARNSCMKGDDCPFDHQLSKYPCSNFASNGFCSRGDSCLFSHKIPSEDKSVAALKVVEVKNKVESLMGDSTSKKQKISDAASQYISAVSKQSESLAKGIRIVSVGSSLPADKQKQQILSQISSVDTKAGSHVDRLGTGTVQNSNGVLHKTRPIVAPKGVNILSFGGQRDDSNESKLTSSSTSGNNNMIANKSALDSSKTLSQTSSAPVLESTPKIIKPSVVPKGTNFLAFGNTLTKAPNQMAPGSTPKGMGFLSFGNASTKTHIQMTPDFTPKGIQAVVPKGIISLSAGKTLVDNSSDKGKAKLTSISDEPKKSNVISSTLSSLPISLLQSSGHSASMTPPNSTQKTLFSTLAFAAKYESRINSIHSTLTPEAKKETVIEPMSKGSLGGSLDNLSRATGILEFLSTYGSNKNQ